MRIIKTNEVDDAVIVANPPMVSTMPESNLVLQDRSIARTTSLAEQVIFLRWEEVRIINCAALLRHNLSNTATWRIQLYEREDWVDEIYDSGAELANEPKPFGELEWGYDPFGAGYFTGWAYALSEMWLDDAYYTKSAKITILDADNVDGYVQAARLFLGEYWEPEYDADYGAALSWFEETKQSSVSSGSLRSEAGEPYRLLNFDIGFMTEPDRVKILEILRLRGLRKDLYISFFYGESTQRSRDYSMHCKLIDTPNPRLMAFFKDSKEMLSLNCKLREM